MKTKYKDKIRQLDIALKMLTAICNDRHASDDLTWGDAIDVWDERYDALHDRIRAIEDRLGVYTVTGDK